MSPPTLTSISVTPSSASVQVGSTRQYTATGTYSDSTTADITASVAWSSSTPSVASVSSTGLALGLSAGTVVIIAALSGIQGTGGFSVVAVPPVIPVFPSGPTYPPQPDIGSWAQAIYNDLEPLAKDDPALGYPLAIYLGAFGTGMQKIDDWVRDDTVTDRPGWAIFLDPDLCPVEALPWLGQFVGVTLPPGLTEVQQRATIKATAGWKRGSPGAIIGAAKQFLTGKQTVLIKERDPAACPSDPAYGLTVITYQKETPNQAQVLAALIAQKPAGIILNYVVELGNYYQDVYTKNATYQTVYTKYQTYQGLATDTPGT